MTVQTLAFTIVLLLLSSFSFAQEKKKLAFTKCTCEYTFVYKIGDPSTFSKVLYDVSEISYILTENHKFVAAVGDRAQESEALLKKCSNLEFTDRKDDEREVEHELYGVSNCDTRIVYQNTTED